MAKASKKAVETINLGSNKRENLSLVADILNKEFGDGTIFGGDGGQILPNVEAIPTGDYGLDSALGIGGVPKGRIIEIYGPESSGKTTIALSIVREAINAGGTALYVDAENAFDIAYAENMGINVQEDLLISQPSSGQQALQIIERALRTKALDVIVVDSVAALTPREELEGTMEDMQMGAQARMLSKGLRKINGFIKEANTTVIFINQLRMKIGVMFGNPETTPGGRALPFFASVRMDVRQKEKLTNPKDGKPAGIISAVKIVKNKVAPPFQSAMVTMVANQNGEWGVSRIASIYTYAVELELIQKSGAWFSVPAMPDVRAQGMDNMKNIIAENQELRDYLETEIKKALEEERNNNCRTQVNDEPTIKESDFDADHEDLDDEFEGLV